MKSSHIFLLLTGLTFLVILGCQTAPPPAPMKEQAAMPAPPDISGENRTLSKYGIGGFAYKSAKLDTASWDRWAKSAEPLVKDILSKLPDGYALQITGHADASGPEEPVGDKPGNIKISTDRAKTVYDALKKANVTSPKLTYAGTGSRDLLPNFAPRAAEQRRVTFEIVKQ